MKKFVFTFAAFVALYISGITAYSAVRIWLLRDALEESLHFAAEQDILFVGDSHVGCSFVQRSEYHNKVVWEASATPDFTVVRLLEMEKRGELKKAKAVVTEIGYQIPTFQRIQPKLRLWWRLLPLTWNHYFDVNLSAVDRIQYAATHFNDDLSIHDPLSTKNTPLSEQPKWKQEEDLRDNTATHFQWISADKSEMCSNWEVSLKDDIAKINSICKRNGVELIVFSAPVNSCYRALIPAAAQAKHDEIARYITSLGVRYYDFTDAVPDADFRDCHHLTVSSAEKFTRRFYQKVGL